MRNNKNFPRKILLLSPNSISAGTFRLRVQQPAEYMRHIGYDVRVRPIYLTVPGNSGIVILHRAKDVAHTVGLVNYLHAIGCIVVYDTDDLVFDKDGMDYLISAGKNDKAILYNTIMRLCDIVLVSTPFLGRRAENFNNNVMVIRNALSYEFYARAQNIVAKRKNITASDKVVVAYLSGSSSHNNDFKIIEEQLIQLLKAKKNVKLLLVGPLNFTDLFYQFGDQFERYDFLNYDEYPDIFTNIDINLVPLECDEPFCQAKSELKYIEAGAFAIPSVVSPTDTHKNIIKNYHNGIISEDNEWFDILMLLVDDHEKRKEIGRAAYEDVLRNYAPDVREKDWESLICSIYDKYGSTKKKKRYLIVSYIKIKLIIAVQYMWIKKLRS
ncbi:MAG: glycosyltransferase family 4 protein, partial [Kiritimatiellae bacterium]|nr:glycosyltransferase family 4 protein [Kiritimatiellia bacterium]